jgi:Integrase core domain
LLRNGLSCACSNYRFDQFYAFIIVRLPQRPRLDQRHSKSDGRMGCTSNNGSIPLERGSALYDPKPRSDLRQRRHTPTACHGHPGQAYRTGLTLAELFAERLIGSIRRECLDHIIVFSEAHLRRILKSYADYYNSVRTHRSLHKDAPISRPIHQTGSFVHTRSSAGFTITTSGFKFSVHTGTVVYRK